MTTRAEMIVALMREVDARIAAAAACPSDSPTRDARQSAKLMRDAESLIDRLTRNYSCGWIEYRPDSDE